MDNAIHAAANFWLRLGAGLIPCYTGSKSILQGFGPSKRVITQEYQAERYFERDGYNLAVSLPEALFCLDFDDSQLFQDWSESLPAELQVTYTESTPRGMHLFYRGVVPAGLRLVPGVEVKKTVLVSPSTVNGLRYVSVGIRGFLEISDVKTLLFSLLSSDPSPIRSSPSERPLVEKAGGDDLVSQIKRAWPILLTASRLTDLKPSPVGQSRWYLGKCPLHDDEHPSFWVDTQRGVWGCFNPACPGYSGDGPEPARAHDVINLVAMSEGITNGDAIRRLAVGVREYSEGVKG